MVIRISDKIVKRKIDGRYFLVDPAGQILHSLNDTGTFLFDLLIRGEHPEHLAAALCDEYDADELTARQDIDDFLKTLQTKGILEIS